MVDGIPFDSRDASDAPPIIVFQGAGSGRNVKIEWPMITNNEMATIMDLKILYEGRQIVEQVNFRSFIR